jgi:predicted TIM-barrel fold metal-dependent hydrolase
MIIDVHAHYHPRAYTALLAGFPGASIGDFGGVPEPDTDDEAHITARLEMMARAGVGLQVLSPAGGRAPYSANREAAIAAARSVNDETAKLVARYPHQFKAWVNLPLPHVDASLDEMRRGLDELGMIGVTLHCSALDRSLAEDEFLPIYAELDRRAGIVFFHPCDNGIRSPLITEYRLNGAVGTSLEDAALVLHLIARKIPGRFPAITFIVPHLGGPIPMLIERLDRQMSMQERGLSEPPSVTARRFYYDTVCHGSRAALTCALMAFGADHLLPGSDFPILLDHETYDRTFSWIREAGLPEADVVQILEETAPAALRLKNR